MSGERAKVEVVNHLIRRHMAWSHRGFPFQHLDILDLYMEIVCARHNCSIVVPDTKFPFQGQFPFDFTTHWEDLIDIYVKPVSVCLDFMPPQTLAPSSTHMQTWQQLIALFPSEFDAISGLIRPLVYKALVEAASNSAHLPGIYNYSNAEVRHKFPDKRAFALFHSHFVLLVEFCYLDEVDGHSSVFLVQGIVRPSQRANLLYYPMFTCPATVLTPFSLLSAECSCKAGYLATLRSL